jgi:hypothetical protein
VEVSEIPGGTKNSESWANTTKPKPTKRGISLNYLIYKRINVQLAQKNKIVFFSAPERIRPKPVASDTLPPTVGTHDKAKKNHVSPRQLAIQSRIMIV